MLRVRSGALTALVGLLLSPALFAQRDLGTVLGKVTDPSGAAVGNAKVTITEDATGLQYPTPTNDSGDYQRPALKPGTYSVAVEATGFQRAEQKNIILNPSDRLEINITMTVGNVNQTVEVTAAAPLLQTETAAQGANLSAQQVSELPLGGQRNFTFLARLSPGVLPAENGARDSLGGGFSANGVRSTGENNFLLNGVDNNVNVIDFINQAAYVIGPSVEAIGEYQVLTNGYNAEYGRAAGGVVNVNLKSGTNEIHGVLFEILQNEKLNANRWENNQKGNPRSPFKQNQFGLAMGAPIIKNKLFIFGDYQGTRIATAGGVIQNLGYGGNFTIPTQAMINGDFSSLLGGTLTNAATGAALLDAQGNQIRQGQIFDPATTRTVNGQLVRDPFPGNIIPRNRFDPAASKIMSLYPASQAVAAGTYFQNNYFANTPGTFTTDQGDGRVDYKLSDKDSLFGSISWADTSKASIPPFQGILDGGDFNGSSEVDLGRNAQLSYTRVWSPSIVSETRVGYSRLVTSRTQANSNIDAFSEAGIQGYNPTGPLNGGLPQIGLGRYRQVGANDWLPTKEYSNVWDFIQNLSVTKGTHSMKFGFEYRPIRFPFFQVPYPHGELNFSKDETAFPSTAKSAGGPNGNINTDTGDEAASFLLGSVNTGQISTTNFVSSFKQAFAWYAQDDWKVSQKLTVNLGVRYELFSPIGEVFGRQSNFDFDTLTLQIPKGKDQNTPLPLNFNQNYTFNGVTYPALFPNVKVDRGGVDRYLIPWDKTNIGPRIGFAYQALSKTVIRGAYGMFYGGEENQGGSPNRGESAPFNTSPNLGRPAGVNQFLPNPSFANGQATGGVTVGYPTNVFTTFPVTSLQFRSVAQNFRNPLVQKWNFSIQQSISPSLALEVGYQGNHSSHQLLQPDFNACPNFGTLDTSINCNSLRPYPNIGGIAGTGTNGFGNYHALTVKLEKRLTNGLQFISSYTYGHAFANSGTTLSGSPGFGFLDPTNLSTSYATAAWDIRHNFTTGFNYAIPFGKGRQYGSNLNGFVDAVLGGWQTNGILTFHTGQPFTVTSGGCQGVFNRCQPDLVAGADPNGAPSGGRRAAEWFDTSAVTTPSPLTGGNLGLQTNYAPPTRTVDFSLFKDFAFTERYRLQFRAESFNIGNTTQFGVPDANRGDATFGQVTSTQIGSERHIQFALRFQF